MRKGEAPDGGRLPPTDPTAAAQQFRLRLVTNAALPVFAFVLKAAGLIDFPAKPVLVLAAVLLSLNLIYLASLRWMFRNKLLPVTYILDVLLVTAILHFLGGPDIQLLILIYVLTIMRAAHHQSPAMSFIVGNTAVVAYGTMVYLEAARIIEPIEVIPGLSIPEEARVLLVILAFLLINLAAGYAYLAAQTAQRLASANSRLEELTAKLRRQGEELERRVGERTEELQSLIYTVAHDLKNPVNAIHLLSHYLAKDYGEKFEGEAGELLERIRANAENAEEMIKALMDMFNLTNRVEAAELVALSGLVQDAAVAARETAREKGVGIRIDPDLGSVRAERTKLAAVIEEIVQNAVRNTPSGGGPIEIERGPQDGGGMTLRFRDHGVGIPDTYRTEIFKVFKRVPKQEVDERVINRPGVGLALVRRVMERIGGSVRVEPTPGGGSTFVLTFPRRAGSESEEAT